MKTTIEIPDELFRQAKLEAAKKGIPFRELVREALAQKLANQPEDSKPWMKSFGKLASLRGETVRINKIMDEEFGQIEAKDLR